MPSSQLIDKYQQSWGVTVRNFNFQLINQIILNFNRTLHINYMTVTVNLPNLYGYVLLCAAVMGLEVLIIGFIAGRSRSKVFSESYMKTNFGTEHQNIFKQQIKEGGYPDMGSGYYSRNLPYQQWFQFNNAQRAHLNFVQWIATCLAFLLIGGLYFPIPAAALGAAVIVSRLIYAIGYQSSGPNGRIVGALINDLSVLALFVLAVLTSIYFILGHQLPN